MIIANADGAVELYYNNSKKLETLNGGGNLSGQWNADGLDLDDNANLYLGTGNDLTLYHDGSNSFLKNDTGNLFIKSESTGGVYIRMSSNQASAAFNENGAVELYYDDSKKFETTNTGIKLSDTGPIMEVVASNNSSGLRINVTGQSTGELLRVQDDGTTKFTVNEDGNATFAGNITVSGTVDGVDIATRDGTAVRKDGTNNGSTEINVSGYDFIVEDTDDTTTNFIWRDHSANKLYLGTDNAVVTARSNVTPHVDSTYDLGTSGRRWENLYVDDIHATASVSDSKGNLREIPQLTKSANYVVVAADNGKHIINSSGGWTINTLTNFTAGMAVTFINNSGSSQNIFQASGVTIYNSADGSTGDTTLAARGMATAICTANDVYYLSGAGLT